MGKPASIRQISYSSYEFTKTSSLGNYMYPQVFHSKLKKAYRKSYPDSSLSSLASSALNTSHLSRQTVCLLDSLDLEPLTIDLSCFEYRLISWFLRLRFCGRCRN